MGGKLIKIQLKEYLDMNCKKCKTKIKSWIYADDDGRVVGTCVCGYKISWITKGRTDRKPITWEFINSVVPAMAIFENGKQRKQTAKDIALYRAYLTNQAIKEGLIE